MEVTKDMKEGVGRRNCPKSLWEVLEGGIQPLHGLCRPTPVVPGCAGSSTCSLKTNTVWKAAFERTATTPERPLKKTALF